MHACIPLRSCALLVRSASDPPLPLRACTWRQASSSARLAALLMLLRCCSLAIAASTRCSMIHGLQPQQPHLTVAASAWHLMLLGQLPIQVRSLWLLSKQHGHCAGQVGMALRCTPTGERYAACLNCWLGRSLLEAACVGDGRAARAPAHSLLAARHATQAHWPASPLHRCSSAVQCSGRPRHRPACLAAGTRCCGGGGAAAAVCHATCALVGREHTR